MYNIKKSEIIIYVVSLAITTWIILSVVDVVLHNTPGTSGYEHYAVWNLFNICMNLYKASQH